MSVIAFARVESSDRAFPELVVGYTDGQVERVSMAPKAAFRLKRFFDRYGLGDVDYLEFDDATGELLAPNLIGLEASET